MPTYQEYKDFCKTVKRQPLCETAFNSLIAIGFCPIKGDYRKAV